jgi:O-antigen ligase
MRALPFVAVAVAGYELIPTRPITLPGVQRLSSSLSQLSTDARWELWKRSLELWREHPVLGVGLGQFGRFSGDILGESRFTGTGFVAHNTFLSFLAELGTVGFCLALLGLWACVRAIGRLRTTESTHLVAALRLGLLAIVLQMLTLNLQNVRFVWVFFGLCLGLEQALSTRTVHEENAVGPVSRRSVRRA